MGGQRWDRAVEEALATCQSMIVVLSPESVASNNVMDEVSYALEENKLVIPVLRKDCSIPFRLRRVQRIDFTADYDTGFADLLRALGIEQPAPTPEPAEAEAPGVEDVAEPAEETPVEALSTEQLPVKTKPPEPENPIAQKVDEPLAATPTEAESKPPKTQTPQHPAAQPTLTVTSRKTTPRERMIGALAGAVAGTIVGMIAMSTVANADAYGFLLGLGGAIAGAISGTHRRVIVTVLVVSVIGWLAVSIMFFALEERDFVAIGGVFAAPIGAILGAMVGVILKKRLGWT